MEKYMVQDLFTGNYLTISGDGNNYIFVNKPDNYRDFLRLCYFMNYQDAEYVILNKIKDLPVLPTIIKVFV